MHSYNKKFYNNLSEKTLFQRDILEKVHRLIILLEYLNLNTQFQDMLALKGGTAINLTIFNLPRLSVDIDLDFSSDVSREEMLEKRNDINTLLIKYFKSEGYTISAKSKNYFSLDAWVAGYLNTSGNYDNIKIEINYSLRQHILPIEKRIIGADIFSIKRNVNCVSVIELIASKISALLSRAAARDLYDIFNIVEFGIIKKKDIDLLRKCIIFYKTISSEDNSIKLESSILDRITAQRIKTDLLPLLRKKDVFDFKSSLDIVKEFIKNILSLTETDKEFISRFFKGDYQPEILFNDEEIVNRISNHPMAIWKVKNINNYKH